MQNNSIFNIDAKLKLLFLLVMLYFTINLIGVPMAYKIIVIGPLIGPGGLSVLPLIFIVEDIIVELYGYKVSRYLLWLILLSTIIFTLACVAIVHLPSPNYWHLQSSYDTVFNPILKSGPSAVLAIFVGRFVNIILMTKWKIMLRGRWFWLRSVFSTLIGSTLALTVFFILSFWGRVPFNVIQELFFSDIAVRLGYVMVGGIPVAFLVSYLKRKLNIDVYDDHVNFNPFSLDTKNKLI
jgi:uncharacterized integral membrane protein (TIGR00697 family)